MLHPQIIDFLNAPLLIDSAYVDAMVRSIGRMSYDDLDDMPMDKPKMIDGQKVAIIPVHGPLSHRDSFWVRFFGGSSYEAVKAMVMHCADMAECGAILLDIDSPGGAVAGAFDFADWLTAFEAELRSTKPIWSVVNEHACSGAFLIASCTEKIFVPRTGRAGSVGVVRGHVDMSAYDEKEGFKYTYVYKGDRKIDGNPHSPLSPEAIAAMERDNDIVYNMFVDVVAKNRGIASSKVRATQAAIYTGQDAVNVGFATEIASFDHVLQMMSKKANKGSGRSRMSMSDMNVEVADAFVSELVTTIATDTDSIGDSIADSPDNGAQASAPTEVTHMPISAIIAAALGLSADADDNRVVEAFQSLEAKVKTSDLEAATARQKSAGLETALTVAQGKVTALEASVTERDIKVTALESRVAQLETDVLDTALDAQGFSAGSKNDAMLVIRSAYMKADTDAVQAVAAYKSANPGLFKAAVTEPEPGPRKVAAGEGDEVVVKRTPKAPPAAGQAAASTEITEIDPNAAKWAAMNARAGVA